MMNKEIMIFCILQVLHFYSVFCYLSWIIVFLHQLETLSKIKTKTTKMQEYDGSIYFFKIKFI